MDHAALLLLKLLAAHLLGDFVFQRGSRAREKHRTSVLLQHVGAHGALLALVALTEPPSIQLWTTLSGVLVTHGLIDAWTSRRTKGSTGVLILDQALHVAVLLAATAIMTGSWTGVGSAVVAGLQDARGYLLVVGAIVAVPAGSVVIGRWVHPFSSALRAEGDGAQPGLERAGRIIGMFERWLIFVAILLHMEQLVGFVIAAKAVLRLPEAGKNRSRALAEYYLVGSLASVSWAVTIAVVVRAALARLGH